MGCKAVLFDLPGYEYMDRLLTEGFAVQHQSGACLQEALKRADSIDQMLAVEELFGAAW